MKKYIIALNALKNNQIDSLSFKALIKNRRKDFFLSSEPGDRSEVITLAVLPNGRVVMSLKDKTLRVWNVDSGECEQTVPVDSKVQSLSVLPDGRVIICMRDHNLKIWNVETGQYEQTLQAVEAGHSMKISVLSDSQVLIHEAVNHSFVNGGDRLKVWNIVTGQYKQAVTLDKKIRLTSVLSDGRVIIVTDDEDLKIWNATTGKYEQNLRIRGKPHDVRLLPNGCVLTISQVDRQERTPYHKSLVLTVQDYYFQVWNIETRQCEYTSPAIDDPLSIEAIQPNGEVIIRENAKHSYRQQIYGYDKSHILKISTNKYDYRLRTNFSYENPPWLLATLPDSRQIFRVYEEMSFEKKPIIKVYNPTTRMYEQTFKVKPLPKPHIEEILLTAVVTNTSVRHLDLSKIPLSETNWQLVDKILAQHPALETLNISNTDLTTTRLRALADKLKAHTTLTALSLQQNQLGAADTQILAVLLKANKRLKSIDLSNNKIDDKALQRLSQGLKTNTTITTLNLAGNQITDEGIPNLIDTLPTSSLKNIDLSNNPLTYKGILALAEFLKTATTVAMLDLSGIQITDVAAQALAEALQVNTSLSTLKLGKMNKAGYQAIFSSLKFNSSLSQIEFVESELFVEDNCLLTLNDALETNKTLTNITYINNIGWFYEEEEERSLQKHGCEPIRLPSDSLGKSIQERLNMNRHEAEQLLEAAKGGDLDTVKQLVTEGANFYYQDEHGNTALDYAKQNKHSTIIDYLTQQHHQKLTRTRRLKHALLHSTASSSSPSSVISTSSSALQAPKEVTIPSQYICPITQQIMQDPVIAMDSNTYEREAITQWLATNQSSPINGTPIPSTFLLENRALKQSIDDFLNQHPQLKHHSEERYFSDTLKAQVVAMVKENKPVADIDRLLEKEIRLLTVPLVEEDTLLHLVCRHGPLELLSRVLNRLNEKIFDLLSHHENGSFFFELAAEHLGIKGAALIAEALAWDKADYERLCGQALSSNKVAVVEACLAQGVTLPFNISNQTIEVSAFIQHIIQENHKLREQNTQLTNALQQSPLHTTSNSKEENTLLIIGNSQSSTTSNTAFFSTITAQQSSPSSTNRGSNPTIDPNEEIEALKRFQKNARLQNFT